MKAITLAGLLVFSALRGAAAQEISPITTLRAKGELVLVPAVVTEHHAPVSGLVGKDFTVFLDGKPQQISVFEPVHAQPAHVESPAPDMNVVQNYTAGNGQQDVVIVLLDLLNAGFTGRNKIRDYLGKMASQFSEAHTPVTLLLLSSSGLRQVHSFTSNPQNLQKAIDRWESGSPPYSAEQMKTLATNWSNPLAPMDNNQGALALFQSVEHRYLDAVAREIAVTKEAALEQIAEAFVGIPGRKKLIWISNGFPEIARKGINEFGPQEAAMNDSLRRAWSALSSANIAVYPVDCNGSAGGFWDGYFSPEHGGRRLESEIALEIPSNTPSMLEAAQRTGGFNCTLPPKACVENVLADANDYYLLGFYLHGRALPGWHKLEVKVDRPNLNVRARTGFEVGRPEAQKLGKHDEANPNLKAAQANAESADSAASSEHKGEVMNALQSPLDYTGIPLALRWKADPLPSGEIRLELVVHSPSTGIAIDANDHGEANISIDYLAFVRLLTDSTGHTFPTTLAKKLTAEQQNNIASAGFFFRNQVTVAPGRYAVRMFVRDNIAQKIGTVSTLVDLTQVR